MPSNKAMIVCRVEKSLYEKVAACAAREGRSMSNLLEQLVKKEFSEDRKSLIQSRRKRIPDTER